jgi:hypothetical protein
MLPPTEDECDALARDCNDDRRGLADVRKFFDVDEWFAGCSVDDLDAIDVEIVVRWALRQSLAQLLRHVTDNGREPIIDFIHNGEAQQQAPFSERGRAVAATRRLLAELREINAIEPDSDASTDL